MNLIDLIVNLEIFLIQHLLHHRQIVPPPDPISPSTMITQQISPSSSSISNNNNKRPHSHTVNGLTSRTSSNNF